MKDNERKISFWRRIENEQKIRVNQNVKEEVDRRFGYIDDESGWEEYEQSIRDAVNLLKLHTITSYFPQPKNAHATNKQYNGPLQKRTYLVNFILKDQLSVRFRNPKKCRFNWKRLTETWNAGHRYCPMTPAVLKATYYRAVSDGYVQKNIINSAMIDLYSVLVGTNDTKFDLNYKLRRLRDFLIVYKMLGSQAQDERWESFISQVENVINEASTSSEFADSLKKELWYPNW